MREKEKGQSMILTVVLLSGAILSAVSLASLLILFQLRQTASIKESTQAIYAADSGVECVLFNEFRCVAVTPECPVVTVSPLDCGEVSPISLTNDAEYRTIDQGGGSYKSVGKSGRSARSFVITFN